MDVENRQLFRFCNPKSGNTLRYHTLYSLLPPVPCLSLMISRVPGKPSCVFLFIKKATAITRLVNENLSKADRSRRVGWCHKVLRKMFLEDSTKCLINCMSEQQNVSSAGFPNPHLLGVCCSDISLRFSSCHVCRNTYA